MSAPDGFASLEDHRKELLHSIYDLPEYDAVLPHIATLIGTGKKQRRYQRYSFKCPGYLTVTGGGSKVHYPLQVIEVSKYGFQARAKRPLPLNIWSDATVHLGQMETSTVKAIAVRDNINGLNGFYGFNLGEPDVVWMKFVSALTSGQTHGDLENATRFMD